MPASRLSLQFKIIVISAVTVTAVLAVSTFIATLLARDAVEEVVYHKAFAQAQLSAHQLVDNNLLRTPDEILAALRHLQHDFPGVVQADAFAHKPQGHMLATTNSSGNHLELDRIPHVETYNEYYRPNDNQESIETPNGRFWMMSTLIRSSGEPIGCLIITVSKSGVN